MKNIISIFSFGLVIIGLHIAIMFSFLTTQNLNFVFLIHGFLFLLLLGGSFALSKVKSIDPKKVGMTFLTLTVIKMLSSIIFIFVVKKYLGLDKNVIIFNFFAVFFIYLMFEVITALKELK